MEEYITCCMCGQGHVTSHVLLKSRYHTHTTGYKNVTGMCHVTIVIVQY